MTTDLMGETQLICPPVQDHLTTQVVIVGSGAAGMRTALDLAAAGVPTLLVTRGELTDSATDWAQGGLAAVWRADDSVDLHVADTLTAGAGLCDEQAVRTLVTRAPGALRRLMADGASFDTDDAGDIDLHLEGGHHARRILHAGGDQSGHEVEVTLARRAGALNVCDHARLIDICTDCRGATCGVLVARGGTTVEISCDHVVLATGGIGQLWSTTTNPTVSTGDGLAAGLRAGAVARDVEFMQFHPTILVVPPAHRIPDDRGVLISEAVRGEGAFLVDAHGGRVMTGVHPLADLAPRDVVSAAEWAHMMRLAPIISSWMPRRSGCTRGRRCSRRSCRCAGSAASTRWRNPFRCGQERTTTAGVWWPTWLAAPVCRGCGRSVRSRARGCRGPIGLPRTP